MTIYLLLIEKERRGTGYDEVYCATFESYVYSALNGLVKGTRKEVEKHLADYGVVI